MKIEIELETTAPPSDVVASLRLHLENSELIHATYARVAYQAEGENDPAWVSEFKVVTANQISKRVKNAHVYRRGIVEEQA